MTTAYDITTAMATNCCFLSFFFCFLHLLPSSYLSSLLPLPCTFIHDLVFVSLLLSWTRLGFSISGWLVVLLFLLLFLFHFSIVQHLHLDIYCTFSAREAQARDTRTMGITYDEYDRRWT
ncbi:hypothetical protein B0T14DRAFT_522861 [Immersiella caudata]|uniref:Transmembrane protein n=1 Tax=Immersiella caudata TaxID=314043 RepID=A0AA39WJ10_9PEZI|nr:hypothetical protein B0T14DRAFT_522861 [Immersiella caudata]